MNVQKLKAAIQDYTNWLKSSNQIPNLHCWEALYHWQNNWDTENPALAVCYEKSLQSQESRRLWNREHFFPKEIMFKLIQTQPDFARRAFKALFDEEKEIENRISLFKFFCDEMLKEYKSGKKESIENNHYHDNNEMIFLYLAFQFPEQYTLYHYPSFRTCLEKVGSLNPPGPYDLTRFVKISRALWKWMQEDEECLPSLEQKLSKTHYYHKNCMLAVYDFYRFIGK